jgi:hypothetical protein
MIFFWTFVFAVVAFVLFKAVRASGRQAVYKQIAADMDYEEAEAAFGRCFSQAVSQLANPTASGLSPEQAGTLMDEAVFYAERMNELENGPTGAAARLSIRKRLSAEAVKAAR